MNVLVKLSSALYLILAAGQAAAVESGLTHWLGWNFLVGLVLGLLIAPIPAVGTIVAAIAAHGTWGWSWGLILVVQFVPQIIVGALFWMSVLWGMRKESNIQVRRRGGDVESGGPTIPARTPSTRPNVAWQRWPTSEANSARSSMEVMGGDAER